MRISGGDYKRRRFQIPKTFEARPTTDFAKENLFNILMNLIDFRSGIKALDLFAGAGGISAELVSRGCSLVISIEKQKAHHDFIRKVMKELKVENNIAIRRDAIQFIKRTREQFDFIFADPPYDFKDLSSIPDLIFEHNLLTPNALFVLEHGKNNNFDNHLYFKEKRIYGSVHFTFFQIKEEE
ncbi:MAG: RsmD family RNA methyltransferase [Bacteroides sp.]|nr:RsmD family RNA methyltransferase [Bacteroides sp.]MDD2645126.1 RsmD family RNA methyltransferase [Bacteroides sp.]MDD4054451.1 RsmD family RNA methyltransferase [Bacteroides sp.]MDD4719555.1 RsmD family RNA methyltransferase [Bacteroides sp.]NLI64253.1 16S rRNA (guanine(966)-N(2))-methyltransferase RsmD [Bacteroidales bacterium]